MMIEKYQFSSVIAEVLEEQVHDFQHPKGSVEPRLDRTNLFRLLTRRP